MSTSILPGERPDRLEEECAVFGVFAPGEDVARMTCFGLQALQLSLIHISEPTRP